MSKPKTTDRDYSAPALEKGIDILELLSRNSIPLNTPAIAERLGRSNTEIYRMLLVLEKRGFLYKDGESDGFRITRKLLQLGMEQQPLKDIFEYSKPIMRALAEKTSMSCHISIQSEEQIVVAARVEAPSNISYSVRVGYRKPLIFTASGKVLYAFQPTEIQRAWIKLLSEYHNEDELNEFVRDCKVVAIDGHVKAPSQYVKGIIDLNVPIMNKDQAVAALAIPYIQRIPEIMDINDILKELKTAAHEISSAINVFTYI